MQTVETDPQKVTAWQAVNLPEVITDTDNFQITSQTVTPPNKKIKNSPYSRIITNHTTWNVIEDDPLEWSKLGRDKDIEAETGLTCYIVIPKTWETRFNPKKQLVTITPEDSSKTIQLPAHLKKEKILIDNNAAKEILPFRHVNNAIYKRKETITQKIVKNITPTYSDYEYQCFSQLKAKAAQTLQNENLAIPEKIGSNHIIYLSHPETDITLYYVPQAEKMNPEKIKALFLPDNQPATEPDTQTPPPLYPGAISPPPLYPGTASPPPTYSTEQLSVPEPVRPTK